MDFCVSIVNVKIQADLPSITDYLRSQLQDGGIGTKAQQTLKLQHEQSKIERKVKSREQREAESERQYALRQEKKKAKHRGG